MAQVVKKAYNQLCGSLPAAAVATLSAAELLAGGESGSVEFKSTLRTNLHTGQHDEKMHLATLKSIAGFLNNKGGTLVIGATDDGKARGFAADGFQNEDKMALHLGNLVRDRIGEVFLPYMHPHFQEEDGERVFIVQCEKGPKPAFVKDGAIQRFYVRGGNATIELVGNAVTDYAKAQFG